MTASDKVVDEAIRMLLGTVSPEQNQLQTTMDSTMVGVECKYDLGGIKPGTVIGVDTELMRVWSTSDSGLTAIVQRGYGGTDKTAHFQNAIIDVNPRISKAAAFSALNEELIDLSSPSNGLFQMKSFDITTTSQYSYDLGITDGFISGFEVRQALPSLGQWETIDDWRIIPSSDTTLYPSGYALEIGSPWAGRTIRVFYRAPFTPLLTYGNDIESDTGLPRECIDILSLGILSRLGPMREVQRNFTESQGNARRAEDVPGSYIARSFAPVMQKRQDRINAEATRLARLYPQRKYV